MTDQRAFSQKEWEAIRSVPLVAGLAVARASYSGVVGGLEELRTLVTDVGRAMPGLSDTPLIQAILHDHPRWHLARLTGSDTADPDEMRADAVDICSEIGALLAERATPDELEQFRAWVVAIAHDVAAAWREGDDDETDAERAVIESIDAALRVS